MFSQDIIVKFRIITHLIFRNFQLIKVNQPDLVLFVGEALVGNDAIDQLTKFNQSIADHSNMEKPRLIDGIVLTKFDTIDDKVSYFVTAKLVMILYIVLINGSIVLDFSQVMLEGKEYNSFVKENELRELDYPIFVVIGTSVETQRSCRYL